MRTPDGQHRRRIVFLVAAASVIVLLPSGSLLGPPVLSPSGTSGAVGLELSGDFAPVRSHTAVSASSSVYDWPELHLNPQLTGYAANSRLSTFTASGLGVSWATNLYGAALDSPVVSFNSALGKTLAYVGTERGDVVAVDIATGQIVWGTWLGSPIRSSPVVYHDAVYAGTFQNPSVFKLNSSTGAVECSVISPQELEGTPVAVTPPGGIPTVYIGSNDVTGRSGPLLAINAGNCSTEWSFTGYAQISGSWTAASYAVDALGVPLVVFGTSDPDSSVYALNAITGAEVWRFQTSNPNQGPFDVGAGATISAPGANGFADGVVYVPNKAGIMYALDLTTGAQIWAVTFHSNSGPGDEGRSTAALDGTNLVFGYSEGMFDLNAVTGAVVWQFKDASATEALSSPAIAGASGQEIVAVGEIGGSLDVVSLASGTQLYHYKTGGYITASPAVSNGNLLVASSDGFLYDFAAGGGNDAGLPSTVVSSPADGSAVSNPNGFLTLSGSAADPTSVIRVEVGIQASGSNGPWWDAVTASWSPGPINNSATLGTPGAPSTAWSISFPVPKAGGTFHITANAAASSGQSDILGGHSGFAVLFSTKGPHIKASPADVGPGASITVTGSGFAASEPVTIKLASTNLSTTTTTPKGNIASTKVKIPANSPFGETSVTATGTLSGKSATVAITIENSWEQAGYSPGRTSFEPNDPILNLLITPGDFRWVDLAWHFEAGVPANASPAIVNGVAYLADSAGQLFAIDAHNGGLIWTWTSPTGRALNGSPAVDPVLGMVFVGGSDGTLYALSASSGTLVWFASIGGNIAAPVFTSGKVYVTSSTGMVESVSESSGTVSWAVSMAGIVPSAASLDATAKTLVVGELNGVVVALNSTNGVSKWTFATGGAVTAAAAISSGSVYVGSADGSVYALSESTGSKIWSFATGAPVRDTGALSSVGVLGGKLVLLIGSDNGNLYEIKAATGTLEYSVPYGSPITGVAAAHGVVIIETASGLLGAARTYANLDIWHYQTGAGVWAAPAIVDGAIYVSAGDGNLYAFTSYGQAPL